MGLFGIGEQVCNNCVHWQCHSERKIRGNPPKEVYTTSNCDRCDISRRNTLSRNSCKMFRHIGGMSTTYASPIQVDTPSPGEMFLGSIMNFIREKHAIDMAKELLSNSSDGFVAYEDGDDEKRKILERHGMSKSATSKDRQAFEVLYEGAISDDATAQLYLAHCFQHGEYGAVKNARLAAKWCLKSACHNNADAQNLLGTFYVNGFGVEKDLRKAGALFRAAAKLGSREAAQNYMAMTQQNH